MYSDNMVDMDTSATFKDSFIETLEVSSSTSSSIHVGWHISASSLPFIEGFRVHYQKVASTYVQYGPRLDPSESEYAIRNLVADTYYKVCLVVYRNFTGSFHECVDASTTNWQLPVSIGSSIGAVLALSMIVLIVLLSRCQLPIQYRRRKRNNSSRYDTMSSNYHDEHYDFSETVTHGNDEDYVSEFDHDDDGFCEISTHEQTRPKHVEKISLANGLCKNHVHPHMHSHQQHHRNSVGRIQCPSSVAGHHHSRPLRAYSINSDAHAAFLNQHFTTQRKDSQKLPMAKECLEFGEASASSSQHVQRWKKPLLLQKHLPRKEEVLRHERPPLVSQHSAQGFTYFDEMHDVSATANLKRTNSSSDICMDKADRLISDGIKFDDLSALGAVGGLKETFVGHRPVRHWDSTKPLEMTHKNSGYGLGESSSFEEHAL